MGVRGIMLAVAALFIFAGGIIVAVVNKTPNVPAPDRISGVIEVAEVRTSKKQGEYFAILLEGDADTYSVGFRLERTPELKKRLLAELKPGDTIQMTTYPKLDGNLVIDGQHVAVMTIDEAGARYYDIKDYEGNSGTVIRIMASLIGFIVCIVGLGIAYVALRMLGKSSAA